MNTSVDKNIDLNLVTDNGKVTNLSGKERGLAARELFKIDTLDNSKEPISVITPNTLITIAPSYFLGIFGESVVKLGGKEQFLEKYKFYTSPNVMRQILTGISRSLMRRD